MVIDLHTDSPERLIAESSPSELLDTIQALKAWDEHAAKVADYLLNAWVLDICMRPGDEDGLREMELVLHVALERAHAIPSDSWRARWRAYADLLVGRALRFTDDAEIETLWQRRHIPEVMAFLGSKEQPIPQSALREIFKRHTPPISLSPERTSQLLRHLEEHGLIARMRSGRENLIELTPNGRAVLAKRATKTKAEVPTSVRAPSGREGMSDPTTLDAYLEAA